MKVYPEYARPYVSGFYVAISCFNREGVSLMMSTGRTTFLLGVGAVLSAALLASTSQAGVIVNDNFGDGNLAMTGTPDPLDSNWWTSSSSSGIAISPGSLGLVTGTSGRGIHTVFPTQTLANVGDQLKVTFSFRTPETIGRPSSTAFRVGLFDTLGRTDDINLIGNLNANVSASTNNPNAVYGWNGARPRQLACRAT